MEDEAALFRTISLSRLKMYRISFFVEALFNSNMNI